MNLTEAVFALAAGFYTFLSPCAFLLPAYFAHRLASPRPASEPLWRRGLVPGLAVSLAVLLVLAITGLLLGSLGAFAKPYVPGLRLLVGAAFALLGLTALLGRPFHLPLGPYRLEGQSPLVFGVLYALAIVGCSLPVFASLALYAVSMGSTLEGGLLLALYGAGVAAPVMALAFLAAGAEEAVFREAIGHGLLIRRAAAAVMVGVGMYLILL